MFIQELLIGTNTQFVFSGNFNIPSRDWIINGGSAVVLAPESSFIENDMNLFTSTDGTFSVDASDLSLVNDLTLSDTNATVAGQGVLNVLNGGSFAARKEDLNAGSLFSVSGPGSGAEFSEEVRLGENSANVVSARLQVTGKSELVRQMTLRQPGAFTLAEIQALCPSVSGQLVKKVLAQLKSAGRVQLTGRGRGARWRVVE